MPTNTQTSAHAEARTHTLRSFAVMSGVDANGEAPVDLAALGPVDTLVFLMGGSR